MRYGLLRRSVLGFLASASLEIVASAAIVSYHATGQFRSSTFPAEIAVGDQFSIDFTFDNAARDTDVRTVYGEYPGALRSFEFRLIPGAATGRYPGGLAQSEGVIATGEYGGLDRFYLRIDDGAFPQLAGNAFDSLLFVLDDPSRTSAIQDPGGNPSLNEVLHGPLDLSQFAQTTVRIMSVEKTGSAEGVVTSLAVVPEPTVAALVMAGFGLVRCRRRSRP